MAQVPQCGHNARPVFSKGRCRQCAQVAYNNTSQERKRAKISQGKVKRVNRIADTTKLLRKIYTILRAELLPLHTECEGKGKITGCSGKPTEIHHKKGRRGFLLILSKYFGYLCRNCHDYCTIHSKEAKELGLSLPINSPTEYHFTDREIELLKIFQVKKRH